MNMEYKYRKNERNNKSRSLYGEVEMQYVVWSGVGK